MPRPRGYATEAVVRAARDLFWERGYEATSLADLEEHTGLNRSSLYQAFGNKRALFDEALRSYLREVIEPRLAGLNRAGAGLADVVSYLRALGDTLAGQPEAAARGCLVVNSVAELAGRDPAMRTAGRDYRDLIAAALTRGLTGAARAGQVDAATVESKAGLLTTTVMGILLTARIDPAEAARLAYAAAAEIDDRPGA